MSKLTDVVHERLGGGRGRASFSRLAGTAQKVPCQRNRKPSLGCCCCNCVHHHLDHSHPNTDGVRCTHVRGWICGAPELGLTSGWGKHGLCECHMTRAELGKMHDQASIKRVMRMLPKVLREIVETDAWFLYGEKSRRGNGGGR